MHLSGREAPACNSTRHGSAMDGSATVDSTRHGSAMDGSATQERHAG